MGIEIIIGAVFLIGIIALDFLRKPVPYHPVKEELPPPPPKPIPYHRQLRREQQVLKRTQFLLDEQNRHQAYKGLELAIGNQIVNLGAKEVLTEQKIVELDAKGNDLEKRENLILFGKRENELTKKELELLKEKLNHDFEVRKQELEIFTTKLKMLHQALAFQLEKQQWKIEKANDELKLYEQKLNATEVHIQRMYTIKMEWLKLQAKENKLDNEKDILRIKTLYDETQSKIRELHLTRKENKLIMDQRELEKRWELINYIEEVWYFERDGAQAKTTLEHYRKAGYTPDSPLIDENKRLERKVYKLQQMLLEQQKKKK